MQHHELMQLAKQFQQCHLNQLFLENPQRFQQFHVQQQGILFDYSKQRLNEQVIDHLIEFAQQKQLHTWMEKLFQNTTEINHTEQRSAMHWALRQPAHIQPNDADLAQIHQDIHQQLAKMTQIVEKIHQGQFRGATGEAISDVVNIGVGGSDLGPLMMCRALEEFQIHQQVRVHFASTMDGSQLSEMFKTLRPASTLFIISSKSFTTIDTLSNAETARHWLVSHLGQHQSVIDCHFIGVSTNQQKMNEWGIHPDLQLNLWQWVGGRYSLWSAIGLPIAIQIGMQGFKDLLAGAYFIDEHFKNTAWHQNIPVLMALIGIWNNNFLDIHTHAILPYDGRLEYLASYLQQLEMESNGKSIRRNHLAVDYATCPIIWGEIGPNAQHAFYQLLHQGTLTVSTDFILAKQRYHEQREYADLAFSALQQQHKLSIANCLAQSRLLAFGSHAVEDIANMPAYRQYTGNKPSTTIILPELNPYYLGALISIYEHKVFVQAVLWDINPFDQWGVEMGKVIAQGLLPMLERQQDLSSLDPSSRGLLQNILSGNEK